jgi:hypothetical protein
MAPFAFNIHRGGAGGAEGLDDREKQFKVQSSNFKVEKRKYKWQALPLQKLLSRRS